MTSKILYMGTPDFARVSLEALIAAGAEIIGVVTQPDKPKGRKLILAQSAVKQCALEHAIPVYQPKTLRGEEFAALLETLNPELIVVAAYGKLLPENVLSYPKLGCINVHGSLLPKYRGAAPIQRAIMEGERETGITIQVMDVGLDTGDMLSKAVVPIERHDDFETLHDKLADAGAALLVSTIEDLEAGRAVREKQDDLKSTYASKIENADCVVDFDDQAGKIYNQIRALSPFPLAVVSHNGRALKLVGAELIDTIEPHANPGEVLKCDAASNKIVVACREGAIALTKVLPEGKTRMNASDYINGRKISAGDFLRKADA